MLINCEDIGMISVLKIATARLTSGDYVTLKSAQELCLKRGRSAILVDLSAVRRVSRSGLAALVEFQSEAPHQFAIGFFGAQGGVKREIERCALASLLTLFDSRAEALAEVRFKARQLSGCKAVVLVAGQGSRMGPLTARTPKPLLDVLGKSVLEHVLQHLSGFGIRDFILNPGYLGPQIHEHVQGSALRSVQFLNEGRWEGTQWRATALGSASTLRQLQRAHAAFDDDFLVFCGDAITDIDVADLMASHQASGADVTIAAHSVPADQVHKYGILEVDGSGRVRGFVEKPAADTAPSTLASAGIYAINPRALAYIDAAPQQDIGQDFLPTLLAAGGHLQAYDQPFAWQDVGSGRDYYEAVSRGLRGLISGVQPEGQVIRRSVWAEEGAQVSPHAVIVGPVYIGADAVVEAGAKLEGPAVIGAGARIHGRALVSRSIVCAHTEISDATWAQDLIVAPDWAVDHRFADGRLHTTVPLEGAGAVAPQRPEPVPMPAVSARAAGGI